MQSVVINQGQPVVACHLFSIIPPPEQCWLTSNWKKKMCLKMSSTKYFVHTQCVTMGKRHMALTHWGWVTHMCVSKLTIIGSDNGLLPGQRQAIIWTNVGILLIIPLGTNFSEILIEIYTYSFKKMHLKISSRKWQPYYLGLHVLMHDFNKPHFTLRNKWLELKYHPP